MDVLKQWRHESLLAPQPQQLMIHSYIKISTHHQNNFFIINDYHYNIMHHYLSYSKEDVQLLRKCAKIQRRSKSKDEPRAKTLKLCQIKDQSLERTKRIGKILGSENHDELSTKKKINQQNNKEHIGKISQFVIQQQKSEQSRIQSSQNSKLKAVCNQVQNKKSNAIANSIQQRIGQLRQRLNYRLYINYCQLMKQPLYGKYIDHKYRPLKE